MKNDLLLRNDVVETLSYEPDIDIREIGVQVHHGFVHLAGRVDNDIAKTHAREAAERVYGVRSVMLDLDVGRRSERGTAARI